MVDGSRAAKRSKTEVRPAEYEIGLTNQQSVHTVDRAALIVAAKCVLADSAFSSATVSLAIVDDSTIHDLNRRFLDHDWPTDVLSFVLNEDAGHLEGEVVISADTAAAVAVEIGWPAAAEQMLYVIHGMLHLVGFDDKTPQDEASMRAAEARYLHTFGFELPGAGIGARGRDSQVADGGMEGN